MRIVAIFLLVVVRVRAAGLAAYCRKVLFSGFDSRGHAWTVGRA